MKTSCQTALPTKDPCELYMKDRHMASELLVLLKVFFYFCFFIGWDNTKLKIKRLENMKSLI